MDRNEEIPVSNIPECKMNGGGTATETVPVQPHWHTDTERMRLIHLPPRHGDPDTLTRLPASTPLNWYLPFKTLVSIVALENGKSNSYETDPHLSTCYHLTMRVNRFEYSNKLWQHLRHWGWNYRLSQYTYSGAEPPSPPSHHLIY